MATLHCHRIEDCRHEIVADDRGAQAWRREAVASVEDVARVIGAVAGAMIAAGYSEKEVYRVHLSLEEAVVNAHKHGHGGDWGKPVAVRYHVGPGGVVVQVEDEGAGFDPDRVPDPLAPENLERPSGAACSSCAPTSPASVTTSGATRSAFASTASRTPAGRPRRDERPPSRPIRKELSMTQAAFDLPDTVPGHAHSRRRPCAAAFALRSFGLTDTGKVRHTNEDHFLIAELARTLWVRQSSLPQAETQYGRNRAHVLLVADGMGGHQAGEVASASFRGNHRDIRSSPPEAVLQPPGDRRASGPQRFPNGAAPGRRPPV